MESFHPLTGLGVTFDRVAIAHVAGLRGLAVTILLQVDAPLTHIRRGVEGLRATQALRPLSERTSPLAQGPWPLGPEYRNGNHPSLLKSNQLSALFAA
jgi:hypothetical protein